MLEDFIVFGSSTVDPWNRINCCQHPVLVLIEFCQMQGPKPVIWCPKNPGAHLDLDHVAIWLMSSENVHGSTILVFNQQMAVYALVRHSTMLDVTARAFQRPFCLALLQATRPNARIASKFETIANDLLGPLLECNRRLFSRFLNHMLELEKSLRNEDFKRFYAFLPPAGPSTTFSNKIRSVAKQANKLSSRFREAYNINSENCTCGLNYDELFEYFPFLEQPNAMLLMPLFQLAPCVKDFSMLLQSAYSSLIWATKNCSRGILLSNNSPVFRSNFDIRNYPIQNNVHTDKISTNTHNENALKSLSTAFVHIFFPLLAGEQIAILASQQRKYTGLDLINKLNVLSIKKNVENVDWVEGCKNIDQSTQLIGISCNREDKGEIYFPNYNIVDLNNHYAKIRPYYGSLLYPLTFPRNFPSDKSYMLYLTSLLTDICSILCLIRYIGQLEPRICTLLNLSICDQQILANLLQELDLPKYSVLKQRIDSWAKEIKQKTIHL